MPSQRNRGKHRDRRRRQKERLRKKEEAEAMRKSLPWSFETKVKGVYEILDHEGHWRRTLPGEQPDISALETILVSSGGWSKKTRIHGFVRLSDAELDAKIESHLDHNSDNPF